MLILLCPAIELQLLSFSPFCLTWPDFLTGHIKTRVEGWGKGEDPMFSLRVQVLLRMYSCQSVTHYDCFCKFAYSVIVSKALQFVFFCDYHAGCNSHKGVDGTRDTPPFRGTFTCPWNVSLLTPSHRYRTSQVSGAFFFVFVVLWILSKTLAVENISEMCYMSWFIIYTNCTWRCSRASVLSTIRKNLLLPRRFIQDARRYCKVAWVSSV